MNKKDVPTSQCLSLQREIGQIDEDPKETKNCKLCALSHSLADEDNNLIQYFSKYLPENHLGCVCQQCKS